MLTDERSEESAPRTEGTCHIPRTPRGETVFTVLKGEYEKKTYNYPGFCGLLSLSTMILIEVIRILNLESNNHPFLNTISG
jgi:hypothetical protein